MAEAQANMLRTKLCLVKSQSDALLGPLFAFIDKETEAVNNVKENDFQSAANINFKLDAALSFIIAKNAEIHRFAAQLETLSGLSSPNSATTSSSLIEPQTVLPSQSSREPDQEKSDISKVVCRMEALEMTMSKCMRTSEEQAAQMLSFKDEQENKFQTVGETLNCLVSFKFDSLVAKLQQMINNYSGVLDQHSLEILTIKDNIQDEQLKWNDICGLRQNTAELLSRLYALETTTARLIKSHDDGVSQHIKAKQS